MAPEASESAVRGFALESGAGARFPAGPVWGRLGASGGESAESAESGPPAGRIRLNWGQFGRDLARSGRIGRDRQNPTGSAELAYPTLGRGADRGWRRTGHPGSIRIVGRSLGRMAGSNWRRTGHTRDRSGSTRIGLAADGTLWDLTRVGLAADGTWPAGLAADGTPRAPVQIPGGDAVRLVI
jgi:hypothetical protein